MNPWGYDTAKCAEKSVLVDKSIDERQQDNCHERGEIHTHSANPKGGNDVTDRAEYRFGQFKKHCE